MLDFIHRCPYLFRNERFRQFLCAFHPAVAPRTTRGLPGDRYFSRKLAAVSVLACTRSMPSHAGEAESGSGSVPAAQPCCCARLLRALAEPVPYSAAAATSPTMRALRMSAQDYTAVCGTVGGTHPQRRRCWLCWLALFKGRRGWVLELLEQAQQHRSMPETVEQQHSQLFQGSQRGFVVGAFLAHKITPDQVFEITTTTEDEIEMIQVDIITGSQIRAKATWPVLIKDWSLKKNHKQCTAIEHGVSSAKWLGDVVRGLCRAMIFQALLQV